MSDTQVLAAKSVYIDPAYSDSTVSFKLLKESQTKRGKTEPEYVLRGSVQLADCSRKIDWYFDEKDPSLEKIDRAINALREFRKELVKARKEL